MKTLRVGAAFPDPPFNGMPDDTGLDIDLMTAIAKSLGATVEFIPYEGTDFNGIFDEPRHRRLRLRRRRHDRHARTREEGEVHPALPHLRAVTRRRHHTAAEGQVRRRPRRPHHRRAAGQHQPTDRRPARRAGQGGGRARLRLRIHSHGADRPDHRRMRRLHEARPCARPNWSSRSPAWRSYSAGSQSRTSPSPSR